MSRAFREYIETIHDDGWTMKILMVVGSLRKGSFNRQLANVIAGILGEHAEVSFLEYSDLPMMNQDLEYPVPEVVQRIRSDVLDADGLWIVTPEYNHSYPGVLKNLVDWLSRPIDPSERGGPTAIMGKKVAISSVAGSSAGSFCRRNLIELLETVGASPMDGPHVGFQLTIEEFTSDHLDITEERLSSVEEQMNRFLTFVG